MFVTKILQKKAGDSIKFNFEQPIINYNNGLFENNSKICKVFINEFFLYQNENFRMRTGDFMSKPKSPMH
jgi:hypothetical protein